MLDPSLVTVSQPVEKMEPRPRKVKTFLIFLSSLFILASLSAAVYLVKQNQETRKEAQTNWYTCAKLTSATGFTITNTGDLTRHVACIQKWGDSNDSRDDPKDGCKCPGIPEAGKCDLGHDIRWDKRLVKGQTETCAYSSPPPDCGVFQLDVIEEYPDNSGVWSAAVGDCWFVTNNCTGNWQDRCYPMTPTPTPTATTRPTPTPTPTHSPTPTPTHSPTPTPSPTPTGTTTPTPTPTGTVTPTPTGTTTPTITPTPTPPTTQISCKSLTGEPSLAQLLPGKTVNLTCTANTDNATVISYFEFRVSIDSGSSSNLTPTIAATKVSNTEYRGEKAYPIPNYGCYKIDCRACTSSKCSDWGQ